MNELPISPASTESYMAGGKREERVVSAAAHVCSRVKLGSSLPNQDRTCLDCLSTKSLYAQHLGLGVTTILGRPHSFLMCHSL